MMKVPVRDDLVEDHVEMEGLVISPSREYELQSGNETDATDVTPRTANTYRSSRRSRTTTSRNRNRESAYSHVLQECYVTMRGMPKNAYLLVLFVGLILALLHHASLDEGLHDSTSTPIKNSSNDTIAGILIPMPTTSPTLSPTTSPTAEATPSPTRPLTRSQKISSQIKFWGKWHFWDNAEPSTRPALSSFVPLYPNGDVPYKSFPDNAWQTDAVYVNHFLDSATDLIHRAKEVIFTEYGWGPKTVLKLTAQQLVQRSKIFKSTYINDLESITSVDGVPGKDSGGWTTERTFLSLSRRLLHAMMIQDEFTIIVGGGNGKAKGVGNHFAQSYLMQFDQFMRPIFEKLGIKLVTRNMASVSIENVFNHSQTSSETTAIHAALGFGSIYGDNIDIAIWGLGDGLDAATDSAEIDLFYRQALMASKKPPILIGGNFSLLRDFYLHADADVMGLGDASLGVPVTESEDQAMTLPWATRYLKCNEKSQSLCDDAKHKYQTTCWVPRDDVTPPVSQDSNVEGQSVEMPGFRSHQLRGNVLAFIILDALEDALATWSGSTIMNGHPLRDEIWHLTEYYDNIQTKLRALDSKSIGTCKHVSGYLPERVCSVPMKARTEYTPRFNPESTSIRSILKAEGDRSVPQLTEKMLYDGPDKPNPALVGPEDAVDAVQIVSNRRYLSLSFGERETSAKKIVSGNSQLRRLDDESQIKTVETWNVTGLPGYCDGDSKSICGRLRTSTCLLSGHVDATGGLYGDSDSGWITASLEDLKEGIIVVKLDTQERYDVRQMEIPEEFIFDFKIDGVQTSWSKSEFLDKRKPFSDGKVEFFTLLDNPDATKGAAKNIELGIHVRNCTSPCGVKLTHVYWA